MNNIEKELLKQISDLEDNLTGAYNIRKNGESIQRNITKNVNIVSKEDLSGIDIFVK